MEWKLKKNGRKKEMEVKRRKMSEANEERERGKDGRRKSKREEGREKGSKIMKDLNTEEEK